MHPLVGHKLCAAVEEALAGGVLQHDRSEPVDSGFGIALDQGHHPQGLGGEDHAGERDGIAADIHQGAAADVGLVTDVFGVAVGVAEETRYHAELADAAGPDQVLRPEPLRMRARHKRFPDLDPGAVAGLDQIPRLGDGEPDRLLTEHVLAGLGGEDRPGHVQMVR